MAASLDLVWLLEVGITEMRDWKLMIFTGIRTCAGVTSGGLGTCYRGSILDGMPVHSADTGYQKILYLILIKASLYFYIKASLTTSACSRKPA